MKIYEKSWIFVISQRFLGTLGSMKSTPQSSAQAWSVTPKKKPRDVTAAAGPPVLQRFVKQVTVIVAAKMFVTNVRSVVKGIDIGAPFGRLMVSSADCCNCAREVCRRSFDTPYSVC